MSETLKDLRKIETAVVKFRKKLKRSDLEYTVQVSINSTDPKHVSWGIQMTPPANSLAPVRILADSADELLAKVKVASEKIDLVAVEIAYHNSQIQSCDRTKLGHEERIAEIEQEQKEEASVPETEEVT